MDTLLEGLRAMVSLVGVLVAPPDCGGVALVFDMVVGLGLQMLWPRSLAGRMAGVSSRVRLSMRSAHVADEA